MPLYEYECKGGHRFEELRSIDDRNNVFCPMCEKPVRLQVSLSSCRIAEPFSVLDHKGNILQQTQTTEKIPPPDYNLKDKDMEA